MAASATSSSVWSLFTKCNQQEVQCNICHRKLIFKDSSTSSMIKHAKRYHGSKYNDAVDLKKRKCSGGDSESSSLSSSVSLSQSQPSLSQFLSKKQKLAKDLPKYKSMTNAILKMVTVDLRPLSITEDSGFRDFSSVAEGKET